MIKPERIRPQAHKTRPLCFQTDGRRDHRLSVAWRFAKHRARLRYLRFLTLAYKWCTAFRIAYAHIEFERTRDFDPLDIGRAFRVLADRSLVPHERTEARTRGIQTLKATFGDWLPQLDKQIFLMGFEAGEQFVLHMGSEGYTETFLSPLWNGNPMPLPTTQQCSKRDLSPQIQSPE
jgi:hypothetical protein